MEIAMRISQQAKAETVPPGSSQLATVAFDLSKSACEAAAARGDQTFTGDGLLHEFIDEQAGRVREILSAIPSAFHHWSFKTRDGREIQPFDMSVAEMREAVKDVADRGPDDVVKAFGTVWTHVRALSEIRPDAQSNFKRDLCLHASTDGVEHVAELYLAAGDFGSPLLEWAIVDALVFNRILDFASACAFSGNLPDTPVGQLVEGPLLPGTKAFPMGAKLPGWLAILGSSLTEIGVKLIFEAIVLAATWWFSEQLAGAEGLAKWILFTGMTAARWVSAAIRGKGDVAREKEAKGETNLRMLWDMGIAHERIPAMNVGLLRHLFYRLEERGAAFSPLVYAVLDNRGRREDVR
jgi:hypothetical protein